MKCIRSFTALLLLISLLTTSAFAVVPQVEVYSETIYFEDGTYLQITTTVVADSTRSASKRAYQDYSYYIDNTEVFCYTLIGIFEYDGKMCRATDASGDVVIYQSGWSLSDHEESYSGNTVRGTAVFSGPSGDKTIRGSITCDKNGNIS